MKSPVAKCSVMDATATNLPPAKAATNENIKRAHYRIVSNYCNDGCVPAIESQILWSGTGGIQALTYHNPSRYKISTRGILRYSPV